MAVMKQSATGKQLPATEAGTDANCLIASEIFELVSRILGSSGFRSSETLRKVLRYLAEASIEGRADLKEYTIGVDALGKSSDYNPQTDSTVRVQVSKLRQRLDEYYRTEGIGDPILISLPKGGFHLKFEAREPEPVAPAESVEPRRPARLWIPVGLASILAFALGVVVSSVRVAPDPVLTPALKELWAPLIAGKKPVVLSFDTAMTMETQGWSIRNPTINHPDEAAASEEWQKLSERLGNPAVRFAYHYAGFGLVHGASVLTRLLDRAGIPTVVKRSVVLSWEDIESSPVVFMGTGKTMAKIRLLLEGGDFECTPAGVSNRRPQPGESVNYVNKNDPVSGERREQYGLISMLARSGEGKRVFVLGGGSSEGDWGTAEYVSKPQFAEELVSRLREKTGRIPESYQVVIRMRYESRVPVQINYVTHHVLPTLRQPPSSAGTKTP